MLTSHTQQTLEEIGISVPMAEQTVRLARMAAECGAGGVVASAVELPALRAELPPGTVFVTPGIRGEGETVDDQVRVVSARRAIEMGATYIVVGRPIRDAMDPVGAAQRIVDEIANAVPAL